MVAGVSLILMFFVSIFAFGYAHSTLIISSDAGLTLSNIQTSNQLFHAEIAAWSIIVVLDLFVTWAFYTYLKVEGGIYAILSGFLRLVYTGILAFAVSKLFDVATNINTGLYSATQVFNLIMQFELIWSFGLIVFGLHLIFTGLAAFKSKSTSRLISILLVVAGFSYSFLHTLDSFFPPQLGHIISLAETILMLPMIVGELGFGIWLLVKGRKINAAILSD